MQILEMQSLERRGQPPANARALVIGALLWSLLVLPILVPVFLILVTGQTGFLVMLFVLLFPAVAGAVRIVPYLRDLTSSSVAVEGGVIEKATARRYLLFSGRYVLLDSDYANIAGGAGGAAIHTSSGPSGLPTLIPVNTGRTMSVMSVGGPSIDAQRREAVREAREEMEESRFLIPAGAFDAIKVSDVLRIYVHPNTRTTAGVERFDSRLNRYTAVLAEHRR